MKRFLIAATAAAVTAAAASAPALAADVGVSLSIGQPGFYGRLDVGEYPQPQVIYRRPIVIEQVPTDRPPIYLHVPPGHARHWSRHCRDYDACGERVLFVQDSWYNREYAPHYREHHRDRRDEGGDGHRGDHRGEPGNDSHGENRDHGRDR